MNVLARALLLPAALMLGAGCNVRLAGSDNSMIIEGRVRASGQPVTGATVSAFATSVTTNAQGEFSLRVKPEGERVPVEVNKQGFAPTILLVMRRDGVHHYHGDVELTAPQRMVMKGDLTQSMTLTAGDQTITVEVPPDALPAGATLELTAFAAENGPGAMETTEAADSLLQTGGMLYIRAVDAQGNEVPIGGQGLSVTGGMMTDIGPTGPTQAYQLGADAVWTPDTSSPATGLTLRARQAGFWNCDRNYRTTCLRGKLKAPNKACGGQKVTAGGRNANGLYSQDTAGAGGEFCVEGPAGLMRTLIVGSSNRSITFPSTPGGCRTNPGACQDLGEVEVSDADCPKSCEQGQVDTPDGCVDMPTGGTGGGGGGGSVGCGPAGFGGCGALSLQNARLGNGCCSFSSCQAGGQLGSCSDGCGNGWYEAQGRIFGPCASTTGSCIQNAANAAVQACSR